MNVRSFVRVDEEKGGQHGEEKVQSPAFPQFALWRQVNSSLNWALTKSAAATVAEFGRGPGWIHRAANGPAAD